MVMNVNEACALAKTLEGYKYTLLRLLTNRNYLYTVSRLHKYSAVDAEKADETVVDEVEKVVDLSIEQITDIVQKIIAEKSKLSALIEECKSSLMVDVEGKQMTVDAATEYNKGIRDLLQNIRYVVNSKESLTKTEDYMYKADAEGKQTKYYYPVEITTALTYDKKEMMALNKTLLAKANKISTEIDKQKVNSVIEFDSVIELTDTLEDVVAKLM